MHEFVNQIRQNGEVLRKISDFNEQMRRRFQHDIHMKNSECDSN